MTDEEMAEEYADTVKCEWENETYWVDCRDEITDAYLAGLEAGRPKWHDLRKNPDDLPKRDERFETEVSVSVFSSKGKLVVYYFETKEWYCNGQKEEVIAWCEIPKFEELEK